MLDRNSRGNVRMVIGLGATVVLLAGCGGGGGGGVADRAMETITATAAESPDHLAYALDVASRSEAPLTGRLLLEHAGDRSYDAAHAALHGLVERKVEGGAPILSAVFEEKRGALKIMAALALATQGDDTGVAWLLEQFGDPRQAPGADAMAYLGTHGQEDAILEVATSTISSDDERRRDEVYLALGQIGSPRAKELLLAGLDREHGERRQTSIVAVGMTGDPELVSKIAKFTNTQGLVTSTIEALGKLGGPGAVEAVSKFVGHDEALVRSYAVEAMLRAGAAVEAVAPALDGLAQDADPGVRQQIALRLGGVDHELARQTLAALAGDGELGVRLEAMRSLLRGATPAEVDLFVAGAADTSYEVQAVALEALGRVGTPDLIPTTLEPLFDAPIPYARIAAASAVVEILARPPSK